MRKTTKKTKHPFNGLFFQDALDKPVTERLNQSGIWIFNDVRNDGVVLPQPDHMQIVCTSPQGDNHASTEHPHQSIFTDRVLFVTPNQQYQSTEGKTFSNNKNR